ncbi:hypothetical protein D0501_01295 [Leuconostoc holzapfelii]|uniref:Uncharacterized protein n=1 Tax=Leuconostoc holzapfelii TaxID=434464 RepID=A0ABT2NVY8_9LACO|nr:hypothetical protein [Leuconostoc holzapfelii]
MNYNNKVSNKAINLIIFLLIIVNLNNLINENPLFNQVLSVFSLIMTLLIVYVKYIKSTNK